MSVLVVGEQAGGVWHNMSFETIAAGAATAAALNCRLQVAVVGSGVDKLAAQAAAKPVSEVVVVDDPALADYTPDGFSAAVRQIVEQLSPTLVLFPHTYQVRDFAPKLTAGLGKPFLSDVIGISVEQGQLVFVRQLFQGKLNADVTLSDDVPYFASVQSGVFRADTLVDGEVSAPIRKLAVTIDPEQIRTQPEAPFQESKGAVDLTAADIIVSVGRGIKAPENIALAEELAQAIGGELAASRPICDNGWLPLERQIGSSGQTVSPKLYLALGISGAIQHVVGMKGAKTIVVINKDEAAPLFEIADYGIVADLFEVVPALTAALKE